MLHLRKSSLNCLNTFVLKCGTACFIGVFGTMATRCFCHCTCLRNFKTEAWDVFIGIALAVCYSRLQPCLKLNFSFCWHEYFEISQGHIFSGRTALGKNIYPSNNFCENGNEKLHWVQSPAAIVFTLFFNFLPNRCVFSPFSGKFFFWWLRISSVLPKYTLCIFYTCIFCARFGLSLIFLSVVIYYKSICT